MPFESDAGGDERADQDQAQAEHIEEKKMRTVEYCFYTALVVLLLGVWVLTGIYLRTITPYESKYADLAILSHL